MDRLRLAIVGCGNVSRLNAPGHLQHPRCEVVALCDTASSGVGSGVIAWPVDAEARAAVPFSKPRRVWGIGVIAAPPGPDG